MMTATFRRVRKRRSASRIHISFCGTHRGRGATTDDDGASRPRGDMARGCC